MGTLGFLVTSFVSTGAKEARQFDINFKGLTTTADHVSTTFMPGTAVCAPLIRITELPYLPYSAPGNNRVWMILPKPIYCLCYHQKHSLQTRKSIRLSLPSSLYHLNTLQTQYLENFSTGCPFRLRNWVLNSPLQTLIFFFS